MRMHLAAAAVLAAVLFAVSASVFAHHAEVVYDTTRTIELKGRVSQFRWTNPHASIHFMVKNEQGVEEEWIAEMGPLGGLTRGGWDRTTVKPGDEVEMVSHPHKDGLHRIRFRKLVVNGKVLRDNLGRD
ncbi:MAG: DUF6152 family protein [Terriglobia bacterium]